MPEQLEGKPREQKSCDAKAEIEGNRMRQLKEGAQPHLLVGGKFFDALPIVNAAERFKNGDESDVEQDMSLAPDISGGPARPRDGRQDSWFWSPWQKVSTGCFATSIMKVQPLMSNNW